ncbi:MAG: hypothetical protein FJ030_04815 [Chloroflexi bacterium]|nr:hypothetical protein [Chloroflexota bacterium]
MLKPIRWKTFPRDFVVIEIGLGLFGFGIAMLIRCGLGTSSWAVFEVAMSNILRVTPGTMVVIDGVWVLGLVLLLREKIGWGTLANIVSIGPWEDLFLFLIPPIDGVWTDSLWLRAAYFAIAMIAMGLASAIYIGVNAGAGPRDSLMLAIYRTTGWSIRAARTSIDVTIALAGILLHGPFGAGTIAFALLIGPSVQMWFTLIKVKPHATEAEQPIPDGMTR